MARQLRRINDNAGVKIATWNFNGILARQAELHEFMDL
jgi:hypothetical protein